MATEDANNLTLLRRERVPGRSYDLYMAGNPSVVHVDGSIGASFGPVTARLEFFRVTNVDMSEGPGGVPIEIREQMLSLIIPTTAFAEFVVNAYNGLRANEALLTQAMENMAPALRSILNSLGAPDGTAP